MRRRKPRSVVAERGQVTIPKSIRDRLGLEPGTIVIFEVAKDGKLVISKERPTDAVAGLYGSLKGRTGYVSTDDYLNAIRGEGA